jgi:flagellin
LNNQINLGGPNGLNFSVDVTSGATAAATSATTLKVTDNSLVFQIGANANETAKIGLSNTTAASLGQGVTGLSNVATTDLSKIDVTSQAGAQDAIKVVDAAINQVSVLRGNLGAFQANTLESNARNLSTTLQNTTAAESVIRDTDFASEIANYTKLQTQVQAGATVLGNANQTTQLVAQLLRG